MKTFPLTNSTTKDAEGNVPSIPALGLGTWKSDPGVVGEAVETAIASGYRHLDCAFFYLNEPEIGASLKKALETTPRSEFFLTSKLWCNSHAPEDVEPALRKTLADLGVDCLDMYLMHWPVAVSKESLDLRGATYISWFGM